MRIAKVPGVAVLALAIFGVGIKVGALLGMQQFALQDGAVKAALLTGELRALRAGETQKVIASKEIELDGEIVKALTFRDHGYPVLLWPFDGGYEHDRYLQSVARYRAEHAAAIPQLPIQQNTPMTGEMMTYAEEVRERTNQLVREYAK